MTSPTGLERLIEFLRANRPTSIAPDDMRAWFVNLMAATPTPPGASLEQSTCPVPAYWLRPEGSHADRIILYLHGGAYILGSPETHLEMVFRFAKAARANALLVDYRLLPEHPYPACLEDALAAYQYLLAEGYDPSRIAIAGDSAGGGITTSTAVGIRNAGLSQPKCFVCFSPWVDFSGSSPSIKSNERADPLVDPRQLPMLAQLILNGRDIISGSPLHADLSGLAPFFVQVGTREVLLDDARRLAARLRELGGTIVLDEWSEMIHGFQMFPTFLTEAVDAVERAGAFVREKLG